MTTNKSTSEELAYVVPPQRIPALPVKGTDKLFPVHRIYCIGRNYAAHTIETVSYTHLRAHET